jgi:hypothetical protein
MNEKERAELVSHWLSMSTSSILIAGLTMSIGTFILLYVVLAVVFNLNLNFESFIALIIATVFFSICSCYAFKTVCETEMENGLEMLYLFMQDTQDKLLEAEIDVKSKKVA